MSNSEDQWGDFGDIDDDITGYSGDDIIDDLDDSNDEDISDFDLSDRDIFDDDDVDIFNEEVSSHQSRDLQKVASDNSYINSDDLDDYDSEKIKSFLSKIESEDNNGGEDSLLREQISINKQTLKDSFIPDDVALIDDVDNSPPEIATAGDTYNLAGIVVIVMSVVACIFAIGGLSFVGLQTYGDYKEKQEIIEAQSSTPANNQAGIGSTIANNNIQENSTANTTTTESSDDNGSDVTVPKNGSLVRYEIVTEGDISQVSLSYIDEKGNAQSNTNVSLPWSKYVGMEEGYVPQMRANSRGVGTVTCVINVDGSTFAKNSSSGDNPQVDCLN